MIFLSMYDQKNIKIDSNDESVLRGVKTEFEHYADGYRFTNMYKMNLWDGKISLFNSMKRTLPYGLLFDLLKFFKKRDMDYTIDESVRELFKPVENIKLEYKQKFLPRDYQLDCIETAIKRRRGILISATGSGKSAIISYIISNLLDNKLVKNTLIIVPTLSLIEQFKSDLLDYGVGSVLIGIANKDHKEFNKVIVISTWQTLLRRLSVLETFDSIMVDECHSYRADQMSKVLASCINAKWIIGTTGTLPTSELDKRRVKSFIGPVLREYKSTDLAKEGFLSHCNIMKIIVKYKESYKGDYFEIKEECFKNPYRMEIIKGIIKNVNSSVLVLLNNVEKEGVLLEKYLQDNLKGRKIVFLSGRDKAKIREEWRNTIENNNNVVIVATYQIFSVGVNVKSLKHLILASSSKSKIRVLQSIGRSLRKHESKEESGSFIWDILDDVKHLKKHGSIREKFYNMEEFPVTEIIMDEKVDKNTEKLRIKKE